MLQGNPAKRALPKGEPKPKRAAPPCPQGLSARARRKWRSLAPRLERLGLLTEADGETFSSFCETWARWREHELVLKKESHFFVTPKGFVCMHPALAASRRERELLLRIGSHFGLTPSSRSSVAIPDDPGTDELEDALHGKRPRLA